MSRANSEHFKWNRKMKDNTFTRQNSADSLDSESPK